MYERIIPLMNDYWMESNESKSRKHLNKKGEPIIPKLSIPIMWHGHLDRYQHSELKVVSVSINPHHRAFQEENPQFDLNLINQIVQNKVLSNKDIDSLIKQYDFYFERNQVLMNTDTVFKTYESILNAFDASYLPDWTHPNQALHLDMFTPLATNPTWSKLKKQFPDFAQGLEQRGKRLFRKLVDILNPDLILISLQKQSIINLFEIDDSWGQIEYVKNTNKRNNINAILYTSPSNQHILYGQYSLYGKGRKVFGYASDKEFQEIIQTSKDFIFYQEEEDVYE